MIKKSRWHEGVIGIPHKGKKIAAEYLVRSYEEKDEIAINGGRICELFITIDGEAVAEYNMGWLKRPDEKNEAAMVAYCILLNNYN